MSGPSLSASLAENTTVLIPAAGNVKEGVLTFSNIGSPAMVSVAGRPVIYWTMTYLHSLGLRRFIIGVARRGMFIEDFLDCTFGVDCTIEFVVPPPGALGETVAALADAVTTDRALIVLGHTNFQFKDPAVLGSDSPAILVAPVPESYRWCIARDKDGVLEELIDKKPELPGPLNAVIGVYSFPNAAQLRKAVREEMAESQQQNRRRTEMSAILQRVHKRTPIRVFEAGDWLDCGNADHQAMTHRTLLQKRDFNELSIDPVLGTITKHSRNVEKFIDEINYVRLLPKDLAVLFPRVVDYSVEWHDPWVVSEYYAYPTLAELFVFENADPAIWERVFLRVHDIITKGFMRSPRPMPRGSLEDMYLKKTRKRLEAITGPEDLHRLVSHQGEIEINGKKVPNVTMLWERLERAVAKLAEGAEAGIIHGDLCFSNILYELRKDVCKLIDPRGSFGKAGIYGDPRYDVAKLYHSVRGNYDFITNDVFRVSVNGTSIKLDIRTLPSHARILERFDKVFFKTFDKGQIVLITALLFVSMPALHYDHPSRQLAMYATGLQLLDEYFSSHPEH